MGNRTVAQSATCAHKILGFRSVAVDSLFIARADGTHSIFAVDSRAAIFCRNSRTFDQCRPLLIAECASSQLSSSSSENLCSIITRRKLTHKLSHSALHKFDSNRLDNNITNCAQIMHLMSFSHHKPPDNRITE